MSVKQVIVMRNDLNMRKGKMVAQGSHASISFITRRMQLNSIRTNKNEAEMVLTDAEVSWIHGNFAKICVRVDSEQELHEIMQKAKKAGLEVHLITDSGLTEFNGVPTKTCLAIGPDESHKIDPITGHLKLL